MTELQNPESLLSGSIEQHLVADVPVCGPGDTAADLHRLLVGGSFGCAADIAVCTDGPGGTRRLLGLVPVEAALAAAPGLTAADLMDADPPVVAPGTDQGAAAWKATRHGESGLAVVSADGDFRGLVPPAHLLGVLLAAHERDLARLGGVLTSTETARHALQEPLRARLWHRLPWLVLGLLGSAVAAVLVGGFEADLAEDVRLAFFIPGIVYMADAVGTQTEALVIRGLSVGFPVRRAIRLEALTGLLIGLALAAVTAPVVALALGSLPLGVTVGLALLGARAVASVVAMGLPWLMWRLGRDPAFGSGPLATVVQDLLSLAIYFAVAVVVLAP